MTKKKTGPSPDRVKVDEDWEGAISRALKQPRPEDGWPKPDKDIEPEQDPEFYTDDE